MQELNLFNFDNTSNDCPEAPRPAGSTTLLETAPEAVPSFIKESSEVPQPIENNNFNDFVCETCCKEFTYLDLWKLDELEYFQDEICPECHRKLTKIEDIATITKDCHHDKNSICVHCSNVPLI